MNNRHIPKLQGIALALVLLGVGATAPAQQAATAGAGAGASFQSLDRNGDGRLTRSEIPHDMSLLRTRMSTYDSNQDGALDPREFAAAQMALHGSGNAGGSDTGTPPQQRHHPTGG
jgi:hypothetical protein